MFITRSMIPLSCGGRICPPVDQYTFTALSLGGLWLAVTMMPHEHFLSRTRERQLRRAAIALQEINREAGRRHDLGAQPGEVIGAMPRVVGDRARQRRAVAERVLHVVGQSLRTLADRAVVDGVRADRDTSSRGGRPCRTESPSRTHRRAPATFPAAMCAATSSAYSA